MRKCNFYLVLTFLIGIMSASCNENDGVALRSEGESSRVCLTAPISGQFVTRALPSAAEGHRLRCILEVWNRDEIPALEYREEKTDLGGENVVFEFDLDEGTYDCLFWADFIASDAATDEVSSGGVTYTHYADKYYTTNDAGNGLKAVSVIRSNYGAGFNSEVRDAFFGHYELTKGAAAVENPEIPALTRPFAKLTVKEKNAENYGSCDGLTATYSVPDTFNVLSGRVSDAVYEVTCSSKSSEEQTLFSDYIFSDSSSTLGSVSLTFTGAGKGFADVTVPGGIPLKRNYRTNAEGSLISESEGEMNVQLTVSMGADWNSPDEDYNVLNRLNFENNDELLWTGWEGDNAKNYTHTIKMVLDAPVSEAVTVNVSTEGSTIPSGVITVPPTVEFESGSSEAQIECRIDGTNDGWDKGVAYSLKLTLTTDSKAIKIGQSVYNAVVIRELEKLDLGEGENVTSPFDASSYDGDGIAGLID